MRRREFITLLGGTAAAWPLPSRAQHRKAMPRVGVLWHAANAIQEEEYLGALTKAFQELGYFEGKNIELHHRFPAERPERFRALAQELAESKVDVIVAVTGLGAKEAKRATATIPIVIVADPDPVGNGLVESLAHPGGNVTGLSLMVTDLSGKRFALLKEIVPKLARVAFVLDPRDAFSKSAVIANGRAAKAAGILIQTFDVTTPDEIEKAFSDIARDGFDAAYVKVDKWNFSPDSGHAGACESGATDEQKSTPEPHTGLQGEGGACRRQGRPDDSSACRAVRRPPQSDHGRGRRSWRVALPEFLDLTALRRPRPRSM